jgi:hypothetical protein
MYPETKKQKKRLQGRVENVERLQSGKRWKREKCPELGGEGDEGVK